jgi:uncharacterized membrane protein YfcA
MLTVVLAISVVTLSCALHGAVGFGMNLLAVPVLAILDPLFVPGPAVAAGLLLSLLMVGREREPLDRQLGWAVAGLVPGTLLAVLLLDLVPARDLAAPTGALVLAAVAISALRVELNPDRRSLTLAGIASGFLATAASIGGPPLALVYARSNGPRLRNNLSAFFVVAATVALLGLVVSGHFGAAAWRASGVLLPGVFLGFLASGPLRPVVDRGHTRPAVLVLSAVAGTIAVVQGLSG